MMHVAGNAFRAVGLAALVLTFARQAQAQDPAQVNATSIHVKLENSRVRVLEALLQPGQKEQMHSHPAYVIYVITGGTVRNHSVDGKTSESTYQAGDVLYRDPLTHWAENIGTTAIHLILVELKPGATGSQKTAPSTASRPSSGGAR